MASTPGPPALRAQLNVRIPADLDAQLGVYVGATGEAVQDIVDAALRAYFAAHPLPTTPARPARPRAGADNSSDGTGVTLPVPLVDRLREHSRRTGRNYTDTVLDAVEAVRDRLPAALREAAPAATTAPGALFGRRPATAARDPRQQVNLRFGTDDLAVIDQLWPQVGAPSRSAMLAAALEAYLPQREQAGQSLADAAQA